MTPHAHGAPCACTHHHAPPSRLTFASLLPAVSCVVCPACLALWKPLLSVMGVTLAFSERQHAWLLYGSLSVALAVAAWDVRRARAWLPFWLTAFGAALMLVSHLAGDVAPLEWTGVLVMVASVPARMALRAKVNPAAAA